jgi:hypothetical protein
MLWAFGSLEVTTDDLTELELREVPAFSSTPMTGKPIKIPPKKV